jgi:hypothetical protein
MPLFRKRVTIEQAGFDLVSLLFETIRRMDESREEHLQDLANKCEIDAARLGRRVIMRWRTPYKPWVSGTDRGERLG